MKHRTLDLLLLVAATSGGILAWQTGRYRNWLQAEYARLATVAGDLPIADPSKIYIRALNTGDPLHFAWRIYIPPNHPVEGFMGGGALISHPYLQSPEFIAHVRFRESSEGTLEVYTQVGDQSNTVEFGNEALVTFLHGRWDKLQAEQLGVDAATALDPDQFAVVFRLKMPKDMEAEARQTLDSQLQDLFVPVFFEFTLGDKPEDGFEAPREPNEEWGTDTKPQRAIP